MSAFAPITLDDGNDPPVAVIFSPSAIDSAGVAKLYAPGDGGFETRPALTLSVRLPKVGGSVARVTGKIVVPVVDSVSGLKVSESIGNIEFVLPKQAIELDRTHVLQFMIGFLASAEMTNAVLKLESVY